MFILIKDDLKTYDQLLNLSVEAVRLNFTSGSLPITLLSDLFDCKTIERCDQLFDLIEKRVNVWKEDLFFKNVKNQLLRSCNDLLRRLFKSQNTVFCGRILIFLARFFPLFERSGLNLISEFNFENSVKISTEDEGVFDQNESTATDEELVLEEGEMPNSIDRIDFQFYLKFWSLQEFFRLPTLCYNRLSWKSFQSNANDVIALFGAKKLENQNTGFSNLSAVDNRFNFSKYLTNQKLLELQVADSNFRRYILIQFLILFQYLIGRVRFKTDLQVLSEEQLAWVNETSDRILTLIEETPPHGRKMRECITQLLTREQFWSNWKNEACVELKPCNKKAEVQFTPVPKQRIGDEIRNAERFNRMLIGNGDLTRLWNVCPNNWDSCKTAERAFTPVKKDYFYEIMNATPEYQEVLLNDSNFTWRALRVLSQQSTHFFPQSNQALQPVKKYLSEAIKQLRIEFKIDSGSSVSTPEAEETNDSRTKRKIELDAASAISSKKICVSEREDKEEQLLTTTVTNEKSEVGKTRKLDDITIDDAEDISDDELLKHEESNENSNLNDDEMNGNGHGEPMETDQVLTSKLPILDHLAAKIKEVWSKLATSCKFYEDEIDFILKEKKDSHAQAKHFLILWIERHDDPDDATLSRLQSELRKAKLDVCLT